MIVRTLAAAATVLLSAPVFADQPSLRFDNGRWFDGERFVAEFDDTSVAEVAYLRSLGVFNDTEILRMWTAHCARAFSVRRIGQLADGYEASFVAFAGDPLADFEATRRIALRVKDCGILEIGPAPPEPESERD